MNFTLTCRSLFSTLADQDSVQMLQRSSQVGEFYRMSPPEVWDASLTKLPPTYMGKQCSPLNSCTHSLCTHSNYHRI